MNTERQEDSSIFQDKNIPSVHTACLNLLSANKDPYKTNSTQVTDNTKRNGILPIKYFIYTVMSQRNIPSMQKDTYYCFKSQP